MGEEPNVVHGAVEKGIGFDFQYKKSGFISLPNFEEAVVHKERLSVTLLNRRLSENP